MPSEIGIGGTNRLVVTAQPRKPDEKWRCPKCGRENSLKNRRCAYCGASVLSDKK